MNNGGCKFIRFKDNTYCWNVNDVFTDILPMAKAKAYGTWQLKIDQGEVKKAIDRLISGGSSNHHVAFFSSLGQFIGTDIIHMEESNGE